MIRCCLESPYSQHNHEIFIWFYLIPMHQPCWNHQWVSHQFHQGQMVNLFADVRPCRSDFCSLLSMYSLTRMVVHQGFQLQTSCQHGLLWLAVRCTAVQVNACNLLCCPQGAFAGKRNFILLDGLVEGERLKPQVLFHKGWILLFPLFMSTYDTLGKPLLHNLLVIK